MLGNEEIHSKYPRLSFELTLLLDFVALLYTEVDLYAP